MKLMIKMKKMKKIILKIMMEMRIKITMMKIRKKILKNQNKLN
jgi:hypothetical protein